MWLAVLERLTANVARGSGVRTGVTLGRRSGDDLETCWLYYTPPGGGGGSFYGGEAMPTFSALSLISRPRPLKHRLCVFAGDDVCTAPAGRPASLRTGPITFWPRHQSRIQSFGTRVTGLSPGINRAQDRLASGPTFRGP